MFVLLLELPDKKGEYVIFVDSYFSHILHFLSSQDLYCHAIFSKSVFLIDPFLIIFAVFNMFIYH